MFAKGSMVLTGLDGASKPIETLVPGDTVISPFNGLNATVRQVVRKRLPVGVSDINAPVVIPKHALSAMSPSRDIVVSSDQDIMVSQKREGSSYAATHVVRASDLPAFGVKVRRAPCAEVEYFSLSLENGSTFVVNQTVCCHPARAASAKTGVLESAM